MDLKFDHLWKHKELSDLDVVLTVGAEKAQASADHEGSSRAEGLVTMLSSFPGHSAILSSSPFLRAQLLRWQNKRPREDDITPVPSAVQVQVSSSSGARRPTGAPHNGTPARAHAGAGASTPQPGTTQQGSLPLRAGDAGQQHGDDGASSSRRRRPQLVLTLDSADQQPAAMVVLEALYATKPLPNLLAELPQGEQLQVALLADMWELPSISAAAAGQLVKELNTAGQLSGPVTQQLLTSQALPSCLEPLMKVVLLSVYGDLEAVWADEALLQQMLGLPLHAITLLLSCDRLKVASEDTVLYTAGRYADGIDDPPQRKLVQQQLAPLIRVKHLSNLWLTAAVNSASAGDMLTSSLRPNLRLSVMQRSARVRGSDVSLGSLHMATSSEAERSSWKAPQRPHVPISSVSRTWQVSIKDLQQKAQQCAADKQRKTLHPVGVSAPLGGVAFGLALTFTWEQLSPAGVVIKLLPTVSNSLPDDAFIGFTACFKVAGKSHTAVVPVTCLKSYQQKAAVPQGSHIGICDLAPMASGRGWDDVAWAAAGLPASGELAITMTVSKVSNMPPTPKPAQPLPVAAQQAALPVPEAAADRRGAEFLRRMVQQVQQAQQQVRHRQQQVPAALLEAALPAPRARGAQPRQAQQMNMAGGVPFNLANHLPLQ